MIIFIFNLKNSCFNFKNGNEPRVILGAILNSLAANYHPGAAAQLYCPQSCAGRVVI